MEYNSSEENNNPEEHTGPSRGPPSLFDIYLFNLLQPSIIPLMVFQRMVGEQLSAINNDMRMNNSALSVLQHGVEYAMVSFFIDIGLRSNGMDDVVRQTPPDLLDLYLGRDDASAGPSSTPDQAAISNAPESTGNPVEEESNAEEEEESDAYITSTVNDI